MEIKVKKKSSFTWRKTFLTCAALFALAGAAHGSGLDKALTFLNPDSLTTVTDTTESGDYCYRYDVDNTNVVKYDCTDLAIGDDLTVTGTITCTDLSGGATCDELDSIADVSDRVVTLTGTSNQLTVAAHNDKIVMVSTSGYSASTNIDVLLPDGAPGTPFRVRIVPYFISDSGTLRVGMADGDGSEFRGGVVRFDSANGTFFRSASNFEANTDRVVLNSSGMKSLRSYLDAVNFASGLYSVEGFIPFTSTGTANGGEVGTSAVQLFQSAATQLQSSFYPTFE